MTKAQADGALRLVLRAVGLGLFAYMAYATLFGPYKTTVVHLAIFAAATLSITFLGRKRSETTAVRAAQWGLDVVVTTAVVGGFLYIIVGYERLLNLWGSSYLTTLDVVVGLVLVVVALVGVPSSVFGFFGLEETQTENYVLKLLMLPVVPCASPPCGALCMLHNRSTVPSPC